jgi:hypothetical protein
MAVEHNVPVFGKFRHPHGKQMHRQVLSLRQNAPLHFGRITNIKQDYLFS